MKVAVVDDSLEVQASICRLLGSVAGIDVVGCAEDVAGAIGLIDSGHPDVVVLDVELRDRDRGMDVLRHVVKVYPHIKVVVLSNFNWSGMRSAFIDAGACAYFDKSMEFLQARTCIEGLLAKHDGDKAALKG